MLAVAMHDPLDPESRQAVAMLALLAEGNDGYPPLSDHQRLQLQYGQAGEFLALTAHDGRRLVGYGHLTTRGDIWTLQAITHPHRRDEGIDRAIGETAIACARADGGAQFELWRFHVGDADDALARDLQLTPGRELVQLRCPLPRAEKAAWPPGVAVRTFHADDDAEGWLAANARIFADHPDQGRIDRRDLDRRMRAPWFDPAGFFLAVDANGTVVGFCWTKAHVVHGLGEIYTVGVDPDRRGTGLGQALVLTGLTHLDDLGLPLGMLYCDVDNDPARSLYAELGFTEHHRDRVYTAAL